MNSSRAVHRTVRQMTCLEILANTVHEHQLNNCSRTVRRKIRQTDNTDRIGIDSSTDVPKLLTALTDQGDKEIVTKVNDNSFPGAIMPVSVLNKTTDGDALNVPGINATTGTNVYPSAKTFKKHYQVVSYKS